MEVEYGNTGNMNEMAFGQGIMGRALKSERQRSDLLFTNLFMRNKLMEIVRKGFRELLKQIARIWYIFLLWCTHYIIGIWRLGMAYLRYQMI